MTQLINDCRALKKRLGLSLWTFLTHGAKFAQMDPHFDEFCRNLSHELRTPLTALLCNLQLLKNSPPNPQTTTEKLAAIERLALELSRLIDQIPLRAR